MSHCHRFEPLGSRRDFLGRVGMGLGVAAFGSLVARDHALASAQTPAAAQLVARAKRVIYLFQSGAPSHLELLDPKPLLVDRNGQEMPDSVRGTQRLTGMSSGQATLPLAGSVFKFAKHGQCGADFSELLPHTAKIADKLCIVRSMFTEAINHDPAVTFFQTGSQLPGRPSIGSWLSYGLGSECDDLPAFIVMVSKNQKGQPLYARLWGSEFLPSQHQGVQFRPGTDRVLYLGNPPGVDRRLREAQIDAIADLQRQRFESTGDAEVLARLGAVRDGLPYAGFRPSSGRHVGRIGRDV